MKDVFKEQLVKQFPGAKAVFIKAAVVVVALVLILFVLLLEFLAFFFPIILVAIIFGAYMVFRHFNIEYEYILTNYELDIDVIYGKSRRKRLYEGNVRDFEGFRRVGSNEMEHTFSTANASANYSSGKSENITYEFLSNYKGKKMRIIFEPNEDILSSIVPFLKRGTFATELLKAAKK